MDPEVLKSLLGMGMGGALAAFMFITYRRDMLLKFEQVTEALSEVKEARAMLTNVIKENAGVIVGLQHVVENNTQAIRDLRGK